MQKNIPKKNYISIFFILILAVTSTLIGTFISFSVSFLLKAASYDVTGTWEMNIKVTAPTAIDLSMTANMTQDSSGHFSGIATGSDGTTMNITGQVTNNHVKSDTIHVVKKVLFITYEADGYFEGTISEGNTSITGLIGGYVTKPTNDKISGTCEGVRTQGPTVQTPTATITTFLPSPTKITVSPTTVNTPTETAVPTSTITPTFTLTSTSTPTTTPTFTLTPIPPNFSDAPSPTVIPILTSTPSPVPTNTPTPTVIIDQPTITNFPPQIKFKAKIYSISNNPDLYFQLGITEENSSITNLCDSRIKIYNIPVRSDAFNIYTPVTRLNFAPSKDAQTPSISEDGWISLSNLSPFQKYSFILKSPKGIDKIVAKNIQLSPGKQSEEFDWTDKHLEPGDLPNPNYGYRQDCLVNSLDLSLIISRLGNTDNESLDIADVNYDGIINGNDIAKVVNTLFNLSAQ